MNPSSLFHENGINTHFQSINTDPDYVEPTKFEMKEHHKVPVIHEVSVFKVLSHVEKTASNPDGLPFWVWRKYALELTHVITHTLNVSLVTQQFPKIWKTVNVRPFPKETNISALGQLRPISATDVIMRFFERKINPGLRIEETAPSCFNHSDQFAFKKNCGTETALLYNQHFWVRWFDGHSNFVRVLSFDFSKAFDSVSHGIVSDKLKKVPDINPSIVNWVIDFLKDRQQRVWVGKVMVPFLAVNRGVPQGTVVGPVLLTIMVNDTSPTSQGILMTKYADDITCSIPVGPSDSASEELENIKVWAEENLMKLTLSKTKELVIKEKTTLPPPKLIVTIKRVLYLKFLGVTFQDIPTNWDKHFDDLMEMALKRRHILRVCKSNGYSVSDLDYLFNCLIKSLFTYCIRVWGIAAYTKYLSQIYRLLRRAFRFGYIQHETSIQQVIKDRDLMVWKSMWVLPRIPCRIFSPHLRTGLHAVGRILTRSHLLILRGLRNSL